MKQARENWVDNIKVFACILVALGHFFQSMVSAGIVQETRVYSWFVDTIYYFHVPLFFICSGYLYQKYSLVTTFSEWSSNTVKKALTLGIPYFVFSVVTWGLKAVFSGAVNDQNEQGLFETLFLSPSSPYWYLYALFFVFLVTPTFTSKRSAVWGLVIASILKLCVSAGGSSVYAIDQICQNELWFEFGMSACLWDVPAACRGKEWKISGAVIAVAFLTVSVLLTTFELVVNWIPLVMGLLGCGCTVLIALNLHESTFVQKLMTLAAKYTMPVFLMHTIFAAGVRSVLMKLGVTTAYVHILCGIGASFAGPVIAAIIMQHLKWPEFFLYPGKFLKTSKKVT